MKHLKTFVMLSILLGVLAVFLAKATNDVAVLSHTGYLDYLGCYHVVGEVQNVGRPAINFVKVEAKFYDSEDALIATRFDLTMLNVILIGRRSPFEVSLLDETLSAEVHRYSLNVTFSETSPIPLGLQILSHSSYVDDIGSMHITGQIKNTGTEKATEVRVIATYYNAAGEVVAAALTFLDPELPSEIDSGQTKPFEIVLDEDRTPYVNIYELTAESNQYAIVSAQYELTIKSVGGGTTNPASGSYLYSEGLSVSVKAVPSSGWVLDHWLLDGVNVGRAESYIVTMDSNHTLTAVFIEVQPPAKRTLIIEVSGSGTTVPGPNTYLYSEGLSVSVKAVPSSGWVLIHWLLDGVNVGRAESYIVTMDSNHTLTAVFIDPPTWPSMLLAASGLVASMLLIALITYKRRLHKPAR